MITNRQIIINNVDLQMLDSFLISSKGQNTIYKVLNKQINKGGKIMRTRDEINRDLKTSIVDLNLLVEASVKNEQDFEERRNGFEDHIRALDMEVPFENTLAGRSHELTVATKKKIDVLLYELEQKTGKALQIQFVSESKDLLEFPTINIKKRFFAFPHQKASFKMAVEKILIDPYSTMEMRIDKVLILINEML